jgi:hypothetical protein
VTCVQNVCSIDVFIKTINSLYSIDVWYFYMPECPTQAYWIMLASAFATLLHCYTKLICHSFRSFLARGWPLWDVLSWLCPAPLLSLARTGAKRQPHLLPAAEVAQGTSKVQQLPCFSELQIWKMIKMMDNYVNLWKITENNGQSVSDIFWGLPVLPLFFLQSSWCCCCFSSGMHPPPF